MPPPLACLLHHRGVVRIGGEDRRTFLQGLVSNDMALCLPGHPLYAALLTPQGKFLHDLFIADTGDCFLIDCEAACTDDLLNLLRKHKLRAKIDLADARQKFDVWSAWGDLTSLHYPLDPRLPQLGARMIVKKGTAPENIQLADFAAYDKHRLTLGVPDGSRDMLIEKSTLLECNIDKLNGVSWSKGCYMGQELTARMHYRALVKKRLYPVKITGPAPAFGSAITFNGEEIGDMRSSCGDVGLALLNIEKTQQALKENSLLSCDNAKLNPHRPVWLTT